ncbi:uncharacterized protein LOC132639344 [Lycium barbarum]|uniref:uncharacterized protein LOC132639344 n=1 Tax=Lycium barbarum TaxID=112863 RepID=UPI00293E010D|nr:uncharacterized protein LOC132639344 [Lycium barbarum]
MDVFGMVQALYEGHTLPKSATQTNLVLIPKKSEVHICGDLRPISLSNFIKKVISRVVHGRLDKILPGLIPSNQSGFVKGRRIIGNVLLTQEIVTDIRKRAEVMSRALNSLFEYDQYRCFDMPKWSANLKNLAYADDTIIFTSADKPSLELTMNVLSEYEKISGQLLNREKSFFYMHQKSAMQLCQEVEQIAGFTRGMFPFKYLGCPIFHSRKRKVYYNDLIKRVKDRLQNWKGRLLSFGGKSVLINSVLQSMPMYLLSAMEPTKYTVNELHKIFARFYWSNKEEGKSRHWSAWLKVCVPKQEGGLGFRSIFDVSKALFTKLWWRFRTVGTLWSIFMWNKHCKKHIPTRVQWKGGSQLWKKMLEARDAIEKEIWWDLEMALLTFGLTIGLSLVLLLSLCHLISQWMIAFRR